jgi:peptidoglycan/LPS O-acetylase OafA/YrhL
MHFKRIDQLRGVAALAVVLCHAAVSAETVGCNFLLMSG